MRMRAALYCAVGVFTSQVCHVLLWTPHGARAMDGMVGMVVPTPLAFWLSPVLAALTYICLRVVATPGLWSIRNALAVGVVLLLSQLAGTSVIKLFFEASYIGLVFAGALIDQMGARWREARGQPAADIAHREAWDVLKLTFTFSLFWTGTVGLGISTQLLKDLYFRESELVPGEMVRYAMMLFYGVVGLVLCCLQPVIVEISRAQERLLGCAHRRDGTSPPQHRAVPLPSSPPEPPRPTPTMRRQVSPWLWVILAAGLAVLAVLGAGGTSSGHQGPRDTGTSG